VMLRSFGYSSVAFSLERACTQRKWNRTAVEVSVLLLLLVLLAETGVWRMVSISPAIIQFPSFAVRL